jgi:hypothetical protein
MSRRTLAILAHYNITAVASGPPALVRAWQAAAPGRIIAGTFEAPLDSLRQWAGKGVIQVLGELTFQYQGLRPTDSLPAAWPRSWTCPWGSTSASALPGRPTSRPPRTASS